MNGNKKVILVDMDGVLADFEQGFIQASQYRLHPSQIIPIRDRKTFSLVQEYPVHLRPIVEEIYTTPGFFENLNPIQGGKEALEYMSNMGHDVFICTTSLYQYGNCVLEKYNWVTKHLGYEWTSKLILTRDKTLVHGNILIDDKPGYQGMRQPSWEHILYDAPYNRSVTDKRRLTWSTWKDTLPELFTPNPMVPITSKNHKESILLSGNRSPELKVVDSGFTSKTLRNKLSVN